MDGKIFGLILFCLLLLLPAYSFCSSKDYLVGEGDVLKIMVYDHDDLTTTVRVGGDGMITFPLLNRVKVAGLSISEISGEISDLLADGYIINPHVNVFIEEFRSRKAVILGQISSPGLYELHGRTTFLELISKAGGLTKDAGDKATIKRKTGLLPANSEDVITIDLNGLVEKGDMSQNVGIMDGDSIYVAKAGLFYVTGEVRKPDEYKFKEDTTIIKAITIAGGFTDKAAKNSVNIIRKINDQKSVIENAKMDEPVLEDDVIVVPESFF